MPNSTDAVLTALQGFGETVTEKFRAGAPGEPEDQLRAPFETLIRAVGDAFNFDVVPKGESLLEGRLGRPDFAILTNGLLTGYVELKAPGKGARPEHFTGNDKKQWERFKSLPNVLYADGNKWAVYRLGDRLSPVLSVHGDVSADGSAAVTSDDASGLEALLRDFLTWQPIVPQTAKDLADYLAPLCRLLRDEVTDSLTDNNSPMHAVARSWRDYLFPNADDLRFADAYAQTVTFALLLARSDAADTTEDDLHDAISKLSTDHALLSRALQVLTDTSVRKEIGAPLQLLQRVIGAVTPSALKSDGTSDPWIYFYEEFLAAYDPNLRKDAGVYYTPVQVVHAQVRLIDELLKTQLGKSDGFADRDVMTLDPAVGTGTYLLGVIDKAVKDTTENYGTGAVGAMATQLAKQIFGFEIMTGPYAVSELRISRAIADAGGQLPSGGASVHLADTLESPTVIPPQPPAFYQVIAEQHRLARRVKNDTPVLVCLGNPPYDRHEAADADSESSRAATGGWVRWGDEADPLRSILNDFTAPVREAGKGGQLKNIYNLYVYFWRWALWKVFEQQPESIPGIVSFISASSYIDGDAFLGMRQWMRQQCDEIWIIDLGGEGRGPRQSENVFAIQTPVAIAIAVRKGLLSRGTPAPVRYASIEGTRDVKLAQLDSVRSFSDLDWETCPDGWRAAFRPKGAVPYFAWPALADIMPWQHSGVQLKRTWPIGPSGELLARRWAGLLRAQDRAAAFRETDDRLITRRYAPLPPATEKYPTIAQERGSIRATVRYGYRSFDRQHIIADSRVMSRPRPELWRADGPSQVYFGTALTQPLGSGPALTASAYVPDLHYFAGRGAKDIIPLYRDDSASDANIAPGLVDLLTGGLGVAITPEDVFAYAYGVLAQPAFTSRFADELASRQLRLPITKDAVTFRATSEVGKHLIWLQTYGERFTGTDRPRGSIPQGAARNTISVSGLPEAFSFDPDGSRLIVGDGIFEPVAREVFDFEVSGLKVVQSWLGYRTRDGQGRRSSPLDAIRPTEWTHDFTKELLELLWVLEATIAGYPEQERLLEAVLAGELFTASELPEVPEAARKPPSTAPTPTLL